MTCLRNDLYCVEWGVKLYSHTRATNHSSNAADNHIPTRSASTKRLTAGQVDTRERCSQNFDEAYKPSHNMAIIDKAITPTTSRLFPEDTRSLWNTTGQLKIVRCLYVEYHLRYLHSEKSNVIDQD